MNEVAMKTVLTVLERAPEWIRHDLAAKDVVIHRRAEEMLAAMIANALERKDASA